MRAFVRCGFLAAIALSTSVNAGVVQSHGALKVQGAKIVDASGKPIQVAGMSLYWPLWGGEAFFNSGAVGTIVKNWQASLLRVPMAVGNGSGSLFTGNSAPIKAAVEAAIANDIYVIIDWHVEQDAPQKDKAIAFFTEMSKAYGKNPHVMFEIWNEPNKSSWTEIKAYATDVIAAIRQNSDNIVIVGSPGWSKGVDQAAASPLAGANIAYTFHFYACTHGASERAKVATAADKIPIVFTEWGTTEASGGGSVCISETDAWLDLAKQKNISWSNWSLSNKAESSAALAGSASSGGGWTDAQLSASGRYVVPKIKEVAAALGGGGIPTTPSDTVVLPGRIEAEKATAMSTGLQAEATTDAGGGSSLGYTTAGAWAEYVVKARSTGTYSLTARVAADAAGGGTLVFKYNGAQIGSIPVAPTGGWQTWQSKEIDVQIPSNAPAKLRVEWTGTASSLVNLNWLEFASKTGSIAERSSERFSARSTASGLEIDLPADARKVVVTDLHGRILLRRNVQPGRTLLPIRSGEVLVVKLSTASGSRDLLVSP